MLGGGSAQCAAPVTSFLAQQAVWSVHLALAGLLLGWLAFAHCRRSGQGATRASGGGSSPDRTARNCVLRIVATSVAAAGAPVCVDLLLPDGIGTWVHAEALFLAALPVLLPLPLKHHLWVQALALRSALARMPQVAWVAASSPRQAATCARFARCARLALLAFVPGGAESQQALLPEQACWMANVWSAVMVGYFLPTAVLAALTRHATWVQQQQQRRRQRAAARQRRGGTACTPRRHAQQRRTAAAPVPKPDSPSPKSILGSAETSSGGSGSASVGHGSGSGSASVGHGSDTDTDSSSVRSRRLRALLPSGSSASEASSNCCTPHPFAAHPLVPGPPSRLPHLASQLLSTWLPLLLPCGALVWAALEVAVHLV